MPSGGFWAGRLRQRARRARRRRLARHRVPGLVRGRVARGHHLDLHPPRVLVRRAPCHRGLAGSRIREMTWAGRPIGAESRVRAHRASRRTLILLRAAMMMSHTIPSTMSGKANSNPMTNAARRKAIRSDNATRLKPHDFRHGVAMGATSSTVISSRCAACSATQGSRRRSSTLRSARPRSSRPWSSRGEGARRPEQLTRRENELRV